MAGAINLREVSEVSGNLLTSGYTASNLSDQTLHVRAHMHDSL